MKQPITLALMALAASATLAHAEEWTKEWNTGQQATIHVDTNDGSVSVEATDGDRIEAKIITRGYTIGSSGVRITEHQYGPRVDLIVKLPSQWMSFGEHSVKIELRVPVQTSPDIHTGDGSIRIHGVHGQVRVHTGDGSVQGDELDGRIEATSGDGSLHLDGRFDGVSLRTGDGSVEFRARTGSHVGDEWRIQTGDGSVKVRLPQDLSANVDAHTNDGSISSDLPLTTEGHTHQHELRGKLNSGGPEVVVRTGDGSIRIERS